MRTAATGGQSNEQPLAQGAEIFKAETAATGGHTNVQPLDEGAEIFKVEEQRS